MLKEKVSGLLEEVLEENPALFLIEMEIGPDNQIRVVIDGDKGVSVNDCVEVSRKIEGNLDREETDFSLEVTSAGADRPLLKPRQFKKNLGRILLVKTKEKCYEAKLIEATIDTITIEWKERRPKPIGKGKVTITDKKVLDYSAIIEAKVMIKI